MSNTNNSLGTSIDFEIPSFYNTYELDSYGGLKIAVFKSKLQDAYFYTPLIIVDWVDFKKELDELKKSSENSNEVQNISIVIRHSDPKVETAIINKIRISRGLDNNRSISLNLLPFKFYKIYAKIGEKKIWINEDDLNSLTPEDSFTTQLTLMHERAYILKGKYSDLMFFYTNRRTNLIWANLYSDGSPYSTTTISALATFLNNTQNTKKLFGDESIENTVRVRSSSSGYGASFSIGGVGLGSGGTDTTTSSTQSKQRLFNRTYVADFFENNKSSLNITVDGDVNKYSQLIDKFIDNLFKNKQTIEVQIDAKNLDAIKLLNNQIEKATLELGESKALLTSKPKIDVNDDSKVKVTVKGVPTEVEKKFNIKTEDDIEWTLQGNDYIPTKVNLDLFSESTLRDEFSNLAVFFNREAKKNTITPFLYPAVWLAKNENYSSNITDKDNPIGSILAFAGTKSMTPHGWVLCDGTPYNMEEYKELFSVIGYKWGKGADDTEFKVPNLQGQFLRGVDYEQKTDPQALDRINSEGMIGEVGSYQEDGFKDHSHFIGLARSAERSGQIKNAISSTDNEVIHNDRELVLNSPTGSKETRPKNAYVNFIIRIK